MPEIVRATVLEGYRRLERELNECEREIRIKTEGADRTRRSMQEIDEFMTKHWKGIEPWR
jgi:hypothetical protein